MITVSIKKLTEAIIEAEAFNLPDMSIGEDYLYNSLYKRLSRGDDVRLSELDFDTFELDDVDTIRKLHSDVLEPNEDKANAIAHSLRGIIPGTTAVAFV